MVGGQVPVLPPPRIPRLPMPPRLHPPGSHTITKFRYRRTKYPTYLVIVLRLLQELVERDLLTHGRYLLPAVVVGRPVNLCKLFVGDTVVLPRILIPHCPLFEIEGPGAAPPSQSDQLTN